MKQNITIQQLENIITNLEKKGLLEAPHTLESRVMKEIAGKEILQKKSDTKQMETIFLSIKNWSSNSSSFGIIIFAGGIWFI